MGECQGLYFRNCLPCEIKRRWHMKSPDRNIANSETPKVHDISGLQKISMSTVTHCCTIQLKSLEPQSSFSLDPAMVLASSWHNYQGYQYFQVLRCVPGASK